MLLVLQHKYETAESMCIDIIAVIDQNPFSLRASVRLARQQTVCSNFTTGMYFYKLLCVCVCARLDTVYIEEAWFAEALPDMQEHDT